MPSPPPPAPRGRDDATRRLVPVHIGYRVLPAIIILASVPRNYSPTASSRVQGSARPAASNPSEMGSGEARVPSSDRRISVQRENVYACRVILVSDLRVPRAEISGGDARRGHVIRRIIGQNFVAARIYVVCVRVCVLVERKRERGVICPPPFPFFSVPRNLVT